MEMLKVLFAEDSPLRLGGGSECAGFADMPDGDFVVPSKAHDYVKSKTENNTIASDLRRI